MGTQGKGFRVLRIELFHNLRPQHTCGTHLGYFHEVVGSDSPEEGEARSESIDVDTRRNTGTEVFETVRQGVGQLNIGRSTGFLHVITGDGDRIELRHLL